MRNLGKILGKILGLSLEVSKIGPQPMLPLDHCDLQSLCDRRVL